MGQAIASMNQYQQMGNMGAIAIVQIKETEQAFKAAVARLEGAKTVLNRGDANVAIGQERTKNFSLVRAGKTTCNRALSTLV